MKTTAKYIIGQKFGKLTVMNDIRKTYTTSIHYECICECGDNVIANGCLLRNGKTTCCKKCLYKSISKKNLIDITGSKFSKLTVLERTINTESSRAPRYICECECGEKIIAYATSLKRGITRSCKECLRKEMSIVGGKDHPLWKGHGEISKWLWTKISNSRKWEFKITIEFAWELFLKQDKKCALTGMELTLPNRNNGARKKEKRNTWTASLDRIDSKIGYLEGNVQWVHRDVNFMKSTHEQGYFIKLCEMVYNYNKSK